MHTTRPSFVIRFALLPVLLFSMLGVQPAQPVHAATLTIHVKGDATGANNGTSWEDAFKDLQSALAAASSGDEIWVAAGTYKPTTDTDRTISFTLKNGVAVYGGFAGTETLQTERDPAANVTILSGDIGTAGNIDNSYHVVVANSVDNNTILDGFTIRDGNANGASPYDSGGGMYSDRGSLRLHAIIFTNNYAALSGGGLDTYYPNGTGEVTPDLSDVVFSNNTAGGDGGGMSARFFTHLSATLSVNLTNVTFMNNVSSRTGGGMSNYAGSLTLSNVTFSGNSALGGGGGLSNAPYVYPTLLTNVTFSNNSAGDGGGGMLTGSSGPSQTTLTNVTFDHNSTAGNGGGIINTGYNHLTLTNATFTDNTAGANGGGISNSAFAGVVSAGTVDLLNTTFRNNATTYTGSGIFNQSGNIHIRNSILYDNPDKEIFGTADATYSIVQGGYVGTGNLDVDPVPGPLQDNGGFTQTMALLPGSPAIDSGDDTNCPETDQRGVKRPQGSHCDIGAYEYVNPIVTKAADTNDGFCDNDCSLREALQVASAGATITFAPSLSGQTIVLESTLNVSKDLNIDGSTLALPISISGNNKVRVFTVEPNVRFALDSLIVRNGYEASGGGIYNQGILTIENSTFLENSADYRGMGLGGGILSVRGKLTVKNSAFIRNVAGEGGGLNNNADNTADLVNVTFTENAALTGAGINNHGVLNITNATISDSTGAGIHNAGTLNYTNTLIAHTAGYDCFNDLSGTINVNVNNLVEIYHAGWPDMNCGVPAVTGDPLLGSLQDNGGLTQTMALLPGSPAIDAGDDTSCSETDQRGVARPQWSHCDIGAYEAEFANVSVSIGKSIQKNYGLFPTDSQRAVYTNINTGPVKVDNTSQVPMLTSMKVLFTNKSDSEMMGLPAEQLSQEYWFPSYNNVTLNSQLRVGNLGTTSTVIKVYLGTTQIDSYTLAAGGATRKNYTDLNKVGLKGGPLRVTSSATKILSTIRLLYNGTSFSEVMGLPKEQLTTSYLFPWYNNFAMTSNLQVSNVGTVATTIKVYLGTTQIDSFSLAAKSTLSKIYPNQNNGPLKVVSTSANIVPSIRVLYGGQSYSEMIGYPGNKLTNEFWYPVYDNVNINSQLRVSNVGNGPTTITVYAGTTQIASYSLAAGKATRYNYAYNTGPLHVVSSNQPILSTVRELYKTATFESFYELMGMPKTQLSMQYYFPWYNNFAMNSELRFALP